MNFWVSMSIAGCAAFSLCSAALAAPTYRVIVLDVQPVAGDTDARSTGIATSSRPGAIPWVSVQVSKQNQLSRAVRCNPEGACVDLFPNLPVGSLATGVGINNSGQMIGSRRDAGQEPVGYYTWFDRVIMFPPPRFDCQVVSGFIPQAISSNANNHTAGYWPDCRGRNRPAFHSKSGGMERISMPDWAVSLSFSGFNGVNSGTKVGTALTKEGTSEAFLHRERVRAIRLGTLGGRNSVATAVNKSHTYSNPGIVVGCSDTEVEGERRPFSWEGGTMTALPRFGDGPACATGINDKATIVGNGQKSGQAHASTAFIYFRSKMYDLNDLLQASDRRFHILEVSGITNKGDISATAISDASPYTVAVRLEVIK